MMISSKYFIQWRKLGLSGENLGDELATKISSIKTVPDNPVLKLQNALKAYKGFASAKPKQNKTRLNIFCLESIKLVDKGGTAADQILLMSFPLG